MSRDASPSMHYKSHVASNTKVERATVLALAFASLLVRGGERVGDLNDPQSEISLRIRALPSKQLRADLKLDPGVRYAGL